MYVRKLNVTCNKDMYEFANLKQFNFMGVLICKENRGGKRSFAKKIYKRAKVLFENMYHNENKVNFIKHNLKISKIFRFIAYIFKLGRTVSFMGKLNQMKTSPYVLKTWNFNPKLPDIQKTVIGRIFFRGIRFFGGQGNHFIYLFSLKDPVF